MSNADNRGRFVWHELMTTDTEAAADFYSKVVPWKTQDSGLPSYTLWMAGTTQIGGLTGLPPDETDASTPPHWIVYVATPDVDATVAEAERLGGKVLKSATDIPDMGRYAVLTDPQGATFAVYTPASPPPEGAPAGGSTGEFTWHELATTDHGAALDFYSELFGWEKGEAHDMGAMGTYQLVNLNGAQVAGIYNLQAPATPAHWLSYVSVEDCAKATAAAKAAGGRVLNGPMEVPGGSWITMMEDPQGGAFAVVEPPGAEGKSAKKRAGKSKAAKAEKPELESVTVEVDTEDEESVAPQVARKSAKKSAKKAAKKVAKKAAGRVAAAAKKAVGKKSAKKVAKKAAKKTAKKSAKKVAKKAAKKVAKKSAGGTRGKAVAKKAAKRAGGKRR